jgi:hypothetical protein
MKYDKITHDFYLNKLLHNLDEVGIEDSNLESILVSPIWTPYGNRANRDSVCDLVVITNYNMGIACALENNWEHNGKARKRIYQGQQFIRDVLKISPSYGLIVVYTEDKFEYRKV